MKLLLEAYYVFDAVKEMDCDATKIFFGRNYPTGIFNSNEAAAIFYARHMKIYPNDKAVYLEVVNTEDGECYAINARKAMHELCLKHNLYPPIIINALKK